MFPFSTSIVLDSSSQLTLDLHCPNYHMRPCFIDNIPPEIISEILLITIESFGSNIRLKWTFPLVLRRVSKRFYHIITDTCSLWIYLYIRQPVPAYLPTYITHSGVLPLVADAIYDPNFDDNEWGWKAITSVLAPTFPRLKSLRFHAPEDENPILNITLHTLPILELLDIVGMYEIYEGRHFPPSHFPALRCLRSLDYCRFERGVDLPETLEELHLGSHADGDTQPSDHFWRNLPRNLRVLRIDNITWEGIVPPLKRKIRLPYLTELRLFEWCTDGELSILQCLRAPRLQTLVVQSGYNPGAGIDSSTWSLDFPSLTHLEWEEYWPKEARMSSILRQCNALELLHIKLEQPSETIRSSISDFLQDLANDEDLLPQLEDIMVIGAPIPILKSLIQARPWIKRLKIHRNDLGLGVKGRGRSREAYVEWQGFDAWVESHANRGDR